MFTWTILFHIVGFVFWIGGLLAATALLAQHSQEEMVDAQAALGQAEMKMLNGIANPGAVITIITGVILVALQWPGIMRETWFEAKLVLVITLLVLHGIAYTRARKFVAGLLLVPRKSWMILHGAISLVFLGILVCVLPGRVYWK